MGFKLDTGINDVKIEFQSKNNQHSRLNQFNCGYFNTDTYYMMRTVNVNETTIMTTNKYNQENIMSETHPSNVDYAEDWVDWIITKNGNVVSITLKYDGNILATHTFNVISNINGGIYIGNLTNSASTITFVRNIKIKKLVNLTYYDLANNNDNISNYIFRTVQYNGSINSTNTLTYNSIENAYEFKGNGHYQSGRYLELMNNKDCEISIDFKFNQASNYCQLNLGLLEENSNTEVSNSWTRAINDTFDDFGVVYHHSNSFVDKYYTIKYKKQGNVITGQLLDGDTVLSSFNRTINTISNNYSYVFYIWTEFGESYITYIKNIKVLEL